MSKGFFDNVTGRQKLILIFGSLVLPICALVLFPEEAQWLFTWVGDKFSAGVQMFQGGTP